MKCFVLAKVVACLAGWTLVGCATMDLDDPSTPTSHVVGQTAAKAAQALEELGYNAVWYGSNLDRLDDAWVPSDDEKIVWQDPLHHEAAVRFNGVFDLVVAPKELVPQLWVTTPYLTDLTISQARTKVASLGLGLAVYDQDGNSVAGKPNSVVVKNHSTTPAGATTHVGATVGVIIIVDRF